MNVTDFITIPDMVMTNELPKGYLTEVVQFAVKANKVESLQKCLDTLGSFTKRIGGDKKRDSRVVLFKDFAPYSFVWSWDIFKDKTLGPANSLWEKHMFGGMIFHGSHDGGGDGSFPTLSVCLTPTDGWSIHT